MSAKPPSLIAGLDPAALFGLSAEETAMAAWEPPSIEAAAGLFPQWQVRRLLGRGGMGAVYEVHQPELDRTVAVKLLPIEASRDEHLVERFRREARTLAKLRHPGIVALLESGVTGDGHLFFVMEHVDGRALSQWISEGRLEVSRAIEIVRQVCEALAYAHAQGVIHRDIKPANILLDSHGSAKVADFGLACWQQTAESSGMTLSRTGAFMGTPAYAAPEQVRDAAHVDHRADIYALGVLLYEMLTGDLPRGVFQPPSRKAGTDVRLDQVVQRALQERPEDRYQAAGDLKEDVTHMQMPVQTRRGDGMAKPGWFMKAAFLGLLLAGVAGVISWSWWSAGRVSLPPDSSGSPPSIQAPPPSRAVAREDVPTPSHQLSNLNRPPEAGLETAAAVPAVPASPSPDPGSPARVTNAAMTGSAAPAPALALQVPSPVAVEAAAKVHVWSVMPVAPALYPPKSLTTSEWGDAVLTHHGGAASLQGGIVVVWDEQTPGKEHRFTFAKPARELAATPTEVVALSQDGLAYLMPRQGEAQPLLLEKNVSRLHPSARSGEMLLTTYEGTLCLLSFSKPGHSTRLNAPRMTPVVLASAGSIWGAGDRVFVRRPGTGTFEVQLEEEVADLAVMGSSALVIRKDLLTVQALNGSEAVPAGVSGMTSLLAVDRMALASSRDRKAVLWGPAVEDSPQRFRLPEGVTHVRLGPSGLMAAW